jgi:hypothetical protein
VQDILFRGLKAPLRLSGAEAIPPALRGIAPGWPFDCVATDPKAAPFYSISAKPDEPLCWCECHLDDRPRRWFDPVNAICDAVSALALALPAERPELICLHAAGVEMAGRLVVFPNIRRAGKSTLSAALAMAGYRVFSDDVIPVAFTDSPSAHGLAMGIAPRLRLPLPDALGAEFCNWVNRQAGPANQQYRYLRVGNQPLHGETLPIGAFVILDRQDDPVAARLEPVPADAAMDALLYQNFTRDRHSADILKLMAATLTDRPVFRLAYSDLAGAVACLKTAFAAWPYDGLAASPGPMVQFRMAEDQPADLPTPAAAARLTQRQGSMAVRLGDTLYLADPEGRGIHRMDPLAATIWTLIEEPMPARLLVEVLDEAFPGVGPDRIAGDVDRLLRELRALGLIEAQG